MAEEYVNLYRQLYGLRATVLRYANVYGPRQDALGEAGVVTLFATALNQGRQATIFGTGDQTRDFVYVGDVARANILALTRGDGLTINIGSGQPTSIRDLWSLMAGLVGEPAGPRHAPDRPGDIAHSWFSINLAREALGWTPTVDLAAGLRRTLDFFNE
jgi:UDP-glucose 4-epimerase